MANDTVQNFARDGGRRLAMVQRRNEQLEDAYAAGRRAALKLRGEARERTHMPRFRDGEAAVCYMNGVEDGLEGL